jgi:flagellar protein FliS
MSSDVARTAYRQIEVNGANGLKLVVMLYDGAIRFLREAKVCAERNDLRGRSTALNRVLAILGELQSTLKMEQGGEIAQSLNGLYTYITGRLLDVTAKGDLKGIDEAMRLLLILNSAWTEIAARTESGNAVRPAAAGHNPAPAGSLESFG